MGQGCGGDSLTQIYESEFLGFRYKKGSPTRSVTSIKRWMRSSFGTGSGGFNWILDCTFNTFR